ncbi:MAG: hypothetical protein IPL25_04260 [Saprospiraceae bacterium]|nr:hypothetical protein [Candidatus Vicinibacter affinis]
MTPTDLANIILKSVFTKDSSLFFDRLFTKERSLQTLKIGQLEDYVIKQETELVNSETEMKNTLILWPYNIGNWFESLTVLA